MSEGRAVLVLAPCTDDEFGCRRTIAKLIEAVDAVYCAAFSSHRQSLPPGLPPDTSARKARAATYHNVAFVLSLAFTRGSQTGVPFAGTFEVVPWII